MRKIFYLFCVAIFASVLAFSCSGDDLYSDNSQEDIELNMPDQFKVIGEKHNEGLDAAFAALKSHYKQAKTRSSDTLRKLSKDECLLVAEQGLKKFCTKNVENYSDKFYSQIKTRMIVKTRAQREAMNPKVYAFAEKIKNLLANEPKTPAQLVKGLNDINKLAAVELSEIEAAAVYAGTSTCYNSYMYWKKNRMKWLILLNKPDLAIKFDDEELNCFGFKKGRLVPPFQTRGWWSDAWSSIGEGWNSTKDYVSDWWYHGGGREVVGADAGSAFVGAVGGALSGSSAGGVGALPGAVTGAIGGAAVGSISKGIDMWISGL